jgi:hypothetical protein
VPAHRIACSKILGPSQSGANHLVSWMWDLRSLRIYGRTAESNFTASWSL